MTTPLDPDLPEDPFPDDDAPDDEPVEDLRPDPHANLRDAWQHMGHDDA